MGGLRKYSRPTKVSRDMERLAQRKSKRRAPKMWLIGMGLLTGIVIAEMLSGNVTLSKIEQLFTGILQ
jgi:hypothetical protein